MDGRIPWCPSEEVGGAIGRGIGDLEGGDEEVDGVGARGGRGLDVEPHAPAEGLCGGGEGTEGPKGGAGEFGRLRRDCVAGRLYPLGVPANSVVPPCGLNLSSFSYARTRFILYGPT